MSALTHSRHKVRAAKSALTQQTRQEFRRIPYFLGSVIGIARLVNRARELQPRVLSPLPR